MLNVTERVRKWWEALSALVLLAVAAGGILYDVIHRFGGKELVSKLALPEEVLILLVALLCGGLGAERLIVLRKIEASIDKATKDRKTILTDVTKVSLDILQLSKDIGQVSKVIERTRKQILVGLNELAKGEGEIKTAVSKIDTAEALLGAKDIEDAARNLIDLCDDSDTIKATIQSRDRDPLSEQYDKTLVGRVLRAKQNKGNMKYHLLVFGGPGSGAGSAEERRRLFQEADIGERLFIRRAKHQWPFEVLIGGDTMIIALVGDTYEVAVQVTDPDFIERASEWYKDIEWGEADRES